MMTLDEMISDIDYVVHKSQTATLELGDEGARQLLRWLEDYKKLNADYIELDNQIRTVNTENDELKRLLMLAMDSIQVMSRADGCVACSQCNYEAPIGEDANGDFINSPHCDKSDCFEWEHKDEAMKLLGGTENAEDRTA